MDAKDSASSGVVTTTARGWPLPIGLPSVTMSGTTPEERPEVHGTLQTAYTTGRVKWHTANSLYNGESEMAHCKRLIQRGE